MRFLIWMFILLPLAGSTQSQLGWRTDMYAGINSAFLNPAATQRTPYNWDVNLVEGSHFIDNNYMYFLNASVPDLLREYQGKQEFYFREDIAQDVAPNFSGIVYDFSNDGKQRYLQSYSSVVGPSFSVQVAPLTRVGLFTRWQAVGTTKGVDTDLSFYRWRDFPNFEQFPLDPFRAAAASWSEVGLNLSQGIPTANGVITLGLNARRLFGHRAAYFVSTEAFDISKLPDNEGVQGESFNFDVAFSNNVVDNEVSTEAPGRGWAADLGFLYQVDLGDGFYRWEFGAAILDIGSLRFDDGQTHQFNNENLVTTLSASYETFDINDGLTNIVNQFSEDVFQDAAQSQVEDGMSLRLPTSVSLQAAYAFNEWARVEATFVGGIAPSGPSLSRSSLIGLTPRIDRHWWSVALPVSLFAGDHLHVGLSGRLGPIFMGTDHLGALFGSSQLTGADFYVGLKLFPFSKKPKAREKRAGSGKGGGGGRDLPCYKF